MGDARIIVVSSSDFLADEYLRVAQYAQIADHLMHEGFYPRAAAILKKILK